MTIPLSAKAHFELCLKEQKHYLNARSHYRLAQLYDDFDQHKSDLVELELQIKWNKVKEGADVLGRVLRNRPSEEAWKLIQKLLIEALAKRSSERAVFAELPPDLFEQIIGGFTKHLSNDALFMSQLQLFILDMSSEERYSKLANRALDFLLSKASADTDLHEGVGLFHVLIAVCFAPQLLERRMTLFRLEQVTTIIVYTVQVAILWPSSHLHWSEKLKNFSSNYESNATLFGDNCWDILRLLLVRFISFYNQGSSASLQANPSSCEGFARCLQNFGNLKCDARNLVRLVFVWRAYCDWKKHVLADEILVWIPENRWNGDVDKIIDETVEGSPEKSSPPTKRFRSTRERRMTLTAANNEFYLVPSCEPLAEAYGLCAAAVAELVSATEFVKSANNYLKLAKHFPDVQRFISESLVFKQKTNEAIIHLNERLLELPEDADDLALNVHLLCANALERNWADAFSVLLALLPQSSDWSEDEKAFVNFDCEGLHTPVQARFCVLKTSTAMELVFDYLHHILYKVYTSATLDHENDELLGSLLVLSQINFFVQGYKSFNRILRHIEAKGSLNYPGLAKYITNVTILEELARIQEFCSEYVSIQIAVPQVQRRIGQSTRHSVRGTRDGQKQSLEEQIRKEDEPPLKVVIAYFIENQDTILQILRNR